MHIPVLLKETVAALNPQPGCIYIDGTLGQAGHASAVMRLAGPTGKLLGIDRDSEALVRAKNNLLRDAIPGTHTLVHGAHGDIGTIARAHGFDQVDAILLDLGVSSDQLDTPERGFSFRQDGPLDMRMRHDAGETAADLVARLSVAEMTALFRELGKRNAPPPSHERLIANAKRHPSHAPCNWPTASLKPSVPRTPRAATPQHASFKHCAWRSMTRWAICARRLKQA